MTTHNSGNGYIGKGEAVQNQIPFPMKSFTDVESIIKTIISLHTNSSAAFNKINIIPADVFSYFMIQEKMLNTNESKVVLFDGIPQYICDFKKSISKNIKTKDEILNFAKHACSELKIATSGAFLCDGISRVDIFCDNSGKLVVNEFENLDANFATNDNNKHARTIQFLVTYYVRILHECIRKFKESSI